MVDEAVKARFDLPSARFGANQARLGVPLPQHADGRFLVAETAVHE